MYYLLDSFIAIGCRNREFLESVAKWNKKEIKKYVCKVARRYPPAELARVGVGELPETDALVLTEHFIQYFTVQPKVEELDVQPKAEDVDVGMPVA
jgi:hypothetical protein